MVVDCLQFALDELKDRDIKEEGRVYESAVASNFLACLKVLNQSIFRSRFKYLGGGLNSHCGRHSDFSSSKEWSNPLLGVPNLAWVSCDAMRVR